MSIETGFRNFGFVDDREEQERWSNIEKRLSTPSQPDTSSQPNSDIDAKFDIKDESPTKEWQEDMKEQMKRETKRQSTETGFFQRNKRQIFDALIVLGVIYVGYKLFFEKNDNVEFEGDLIINCSCEHMYDMSEIVNQYRGRSFAFQSNDNRNVKWLHINCVDSAEELIKQTDIKEVIFDGKIQVHRNNRIMVVGK